MGVVTPEEVTDTELLDSDYSDNCVIQLTKIFQSFQHLFDYLNRCDTCISQETSWQFKICDLDANQHHSLMGLCKTE